MKQTIERKTCSVEDAAKILGIGRTAAYLGVRNGHIPSLRISGRIVVPLSKLNALIDGDTQESA